MRPRDPVIWPSYGEASGGKSCKTATGRAQNARNSGQKPQTAIMQSTHFVGPYNDPASIATQQDVTDAVGTVNQSITTLDAQVAELQHIPPTICRLNAVQGVSPTTSELANITPDDLEITKVILSDGTQEIWQYTAAAGWSLKRTITTGGGDGNGGYSASLDGFHNLNWIGSDTNGDVTSGSIFADVSRTVTVVESEADYLATGCAKDCEIIYDIAANRYRIYTQGAFAPHPTPIVSRFFGTISARQFVKVFQANGNTYCNNYHQCYVYADIEKHFCIHGDSLEGKLTGDFKVTATIDNGGDYTVTYAAASGTLEFPNTTATSVTVASGVDQQVTLTDFCGAIIITANPDSDDFTWGSNLPLPVASGGCC